MRIKQISSKKGFTIIEVMIVLAVTMVLFFMATQFISGKEQYNTFKISINNLQSEFKQILDNVANGYYPPQNFSCTPGNNTPPTIISSSNSSQGSNWGCIFLGDAVQVQPSRLVKYPIIGNNNNSTGSNATSLINDSSSAAISPLIEPSYYQYTNGLTAVCMQVSFNSVSNSCSNVPSRNGNSAPIVGFAVGIGAVSSQSNQALQMIPISGSNLNISQANFISDFNPGPNNSHFNAQILLGGIQICFASGGSNNSALFQIGGAGSVNNVTYFIYNNRTC